jgi:transcriptional regulator of nitric oxide reductase
MHFCIVKNSHQQQYANALHVNKRSINCTYGWNSRWICAMTAGVYSLLTNLSLVHIFPGLNRFANRAAPPLPRKALVN